MKISFYIRYFILFCFFLGSISLFSQTPSFRWEGGFSMNHKFNHKWTLNTQILARETFNQFGSEDISATTDRMESKTFITYSLFNQRKVSLGYMYRSLDPFRKGRGYEHRISQQFAFLSKIISYRIAHRIIAEERIFKNDFIFRLRYRFSYDQPLEGEILDPGEWYLVFSNELLFSFESGDQALQNRLSAGIGKLFKKNQKLQFSLTSRNSDLINSEESHILQFKSVFYFNL